MKHVVVTAWRGVTTFLVVLWNTDLISETEAAARSVERCRPRLAARIRRLPANAWRER
jgi:hypothetical protein